MAVGWVGRRFVAAVARGARVPWLWLNQQAALSKGARMLWLWLVAEAAGGLAWLCGALGAVAVG